MHTENSSISNFKKYVLKILLPVLLIVGVMATAFCFLFEKNIILANENCGAYKVNRIINLNNPNEIPILGSSRAEASFIPEILGVNYFNYGLEGTQENVMLFFIREECKKKSKKSPFIILNIDLDGINTMFWDGRVSFDPLTKSFTTPVKEINGTNPSRADIAHTLNSALAAQAIFPIAAMPIGMKQGWNQKKQCKK